MYKRLKGLTLIELIVTLALTTIMSAIALPHIQKFVAKQQLSADIFKIQNIIEAARNQAITSNQTILICGVDATQVIPNNNQYECQTDWSNLSVITKQSVISELLYTESLSDHYKLVEWSAFQRKAYLELTPQGFTNHQNGTLYLCHKRYNSFHRAVVISKTARVTIKIESPSIEEKCNG